MAFKKNYFLFFVFVFICVTLCFHNWHRSYSLFLKKLRPLNETYDAPFAVGCKNVAYEANTYPRMNATFMVLTRNSDLDGILSGMKSVEKRFNKHFNYPYVFLNDEPFSEEFKEAVQKVTQSKVQFGVLGQELWDFPSDTDQSLIDEAIAQQVGIVYANMPSYHKMCRFFSKQFYKHPLMQQYEWYWRLDPDVSFSCDISYDPFYYMQKHNKVYGYVIAIKELPKTVPNLFRYTVAHKKAANLETTDLWKFFIDDDYDKLVQQLKEKQKFDHIYVLPEPPLEKIDGEIYNLCHFWSNFEIARLDFYQSKEYNDYMEALEEAGGFWAERWGDAPVHSLAVGLLLNRTQVHYFRDLGYQHSTIQHCAQDLGCNCDCPFTMQEIEARPGSCLNQWAEVMGGFLDD
ncbi:mannosyltransferase complex subunit [Schizosaccharomyces cryophilus OY26]|uniref:Mannosyltransferase complex subunit n=1 Tax=Schizosaccharomyces cryophilus (strain OY26 / ATCC MYA-4695 / CBS 11777 / NBRC 106824 / NRRL Y48691) TaxID=653667 RepID=S9VSW0_SCHCR|nr:mannosyltransferase complex subunit [Schizosaccharomyces cryophilus OY26]EPY49225.1 mannosyltransferase complex subunit [Schizosaccharomyces cryophilus OY26]